MNVRKNARWLTDTERANLLKAMIGLKGRNIQQGAHRMNVYDFYPLEHRIVRRRRSARNPNQGLGDGGHGGPAFLPWHREWLLRFERDLQSIDSTVTLPYWDLLDPVGTRDVLFQDDFMGPNGTGRNGEIMSGYFRESVPQQDRPAWWPDDDTGTPLSGFPIRRSLSVEERPLASQRYGFNTTTLTRQFGIDRAADPWTEFPTRPDMEDLLSSPNYASFRAAVENMDFHGWGHVWIGGLMGRPATSPNDPMFFLHHCMVDHAWALWQDRHDQSLPDNIPPSRAKAPHPVYGHNIDDLMWPWDGSTKTNSRKAEPPPKATFPPAGASGRAPVFPDDTFLRQIPESDTVRGEDVIDHRNLRGSTGYVYDTQIPFVIRRENDVFAWIDPLFGDLNLLGTIREQDTTNPSDGDLVLAHENGPGAWFNGNTKDLHLAGRIAEQESDMDPNATAGSWVASHYGQPLAYLDPDGNLHLKGLVRTNQQAAPVSVPLQNPSQV
ncbi:MAG: tyrosinase family protein [Nitrospinae bacterium]|nr:tyrosinase family protein [Nitrospinota bacterium]